MPPGAPIKRSKRRSAAGHVVMMTLATGLVATMALPAYAFAPSDAEGNFAATDATELTKAGAQKVAVDDTAATVTVAQDAFSATPQSEIELIETFGRTRVIGMTINHENMTEAEVDAAAILASAELGMPVADALWSPAEDLVAMVTDAFPSLVSPSPAVFA